MRYLLLFLALPVLTSKQCRRQQTAVPECIRKKIDSIRALPKWNPPARVSEYVYKGQQVYLFTSDCCDQYYMLYDSQCQYICAPSGGMTGTGDGQCWDFYQSAKFIRIVWEDER
jgi:hypothetical protein